MDRLLELIDPAAAPDLTHGYVDLLGDAAQAGPSTGIAQRLMRTSIVPMVYERYWRPVLGRMAKGIGGPSMAEERRFAVGALQLTEGSVVLDVACGTGAFTRAFAGVVGPAGLAVGLDASAPMLSRAVAAGGGPVYLRADAVRPPLVSGAVDGVCCFAALHMFADPAAALESFARILRPGGHVALLTSGRRRVIGPMDTVVGRLSGQRMFGRDELRGLLTRAGFDDVTARFAGPTQLVSARRR